jgi:hypothetical protein
MDLKVGNVYYLKNFTAPKVFNGLYFECLLTDQKIADNEKVHEDLGSIKDWQTEIYKPERFFKTAK